MTTPYYRRVEAWTEADLEALPGLRSEEFEYEPSKIKPEDLYRRIGVQASAFWNSGGGVYLVGLDRRGRIDGGIPVEMGRRALRAWVDEALARVQPNGPYAVQLISGAAFDSPIEPQHVVLVISFDSSEHAPHMAPDDKTYYIRAGSNTAPASHFLVEALQARRQMARPLVRGLLRGVDPTSGTVELVLVCVSEAAALDVELAFVPEPQTFARNVTDLQALRVPVVDRAHPFHLPIALYGRLDKLLDEQPLTLKLAYQDMGGRKFQETQLIDVRLSQYPSHFSSELRGALQNVVGRLRGRGGAAPDSETSHT